MKHFVLIIFSVILFSCGQKQNADTVFHNGKIYTVDSSFSVAEAFAVKDGKIIATGKNKEILSEFEAKEKIDLQGKPVYPGFIDAHCHFYGYSTDLVKCDLYGTKSFAEIIEKVKEYSKTNKFSWILGRGWDQNDWERKEFPDKNELDNLFPDFPVYLMRVDGHAILVNQKALDIVGISTKTKIAGGEIEIKNGKLTGILIDNAVDSVKKFIPEFPKELKAEALLTGQKNCLARGLTTLDDAGLEKAEIDLMDSLQKSGILKMRIYAMANPTMENMTYYFANGKYKTDRMNVRSFKIYADGALGSRGACLLQPYSDKPNHYGFLLNSHEYLKEKVKNIFENDFQMNTHCIGDSANRLLLNIYGEILKTKNDKRWRIEHCQVVNKNDFQKFGEYNIIPSVQPIHATSDMYWAKDRVGDERLKGAYAYKDLLNSFGKIAAGTDFPVENINPLYTFFAATARQDAQGFPEGGFQTENALTREEALRSMTIWAAFANFEEYEKGSIEIGKFADFVILEKDIMQIPLNESRETIVLQTWINGEKVFERKN